MTKAATITSSSNSKPRINPDWARLPLFDKAYGYIRQYY